MNACTVNFKATAVRISITPFTLMFVSTCDCHIILSMGEGIRMLLPHVPSMGEGPPPLPIPNIGDLDMAMSMYRTEGLLWHIANMGVCEATISFNLRYISTELLKGLRYMNSKYVRHGDIKGILCGRKRTLANIISL